VRPLVAAHRGPRLRAPDAVGGDAEGALHAGHARALHVRYGWLRVVGRGHAGGGGEDRGGGESDSTGATRGLAVGTRVLDGTATVHRAQDGLLPQLDRSEIARLETG